MHELVSDASSLEDIFLKLTAEPTDDRASQNRLLKVRSTRTTIGLVLGMVALILLFSLLAGLVARPGELAGRASQLQLLNIGNLAGAFSAIAGLLLVTSEYRHGTIRPTVLFAPARPRLLAAKLLAAALTGAGFGVIGEGLGWTVATRS